MNQYNLQELLDKNIQIQKSKLEVAAGTVIINAEQGMTLGGAMARREPCDGVDGNLEANALIIRLGNKKVAIVSLDLLYVGPDLRQRLLVNLNGALADKELFLCASHTHFAPSVDRTKPMLGKFEAIYLESVVHKVTALLSDLLRGQYERAYIEYRKDLRFTGSICRRCRGWGIRKGILRRTIIMAPNASAKIDKSVRILRVMSVKGVPLALIWNLSCHPTGYPLSTTASPEYPGRVREILRQNANRSIPVIFLQGYAGDVRPNITTTHHSRRKKSLSFRNWINKKINPPLFESPSLAEWKQWVNELANTVVVAEKDMIKLDIDSVKGIRITTSTEKLGLKTTVDFSIHLIKIGKILIVGISAEPVNDYVSIIEGLFPDSLIIPVGYIDHVYGYLPSTRMLKEYGYEVDGFKKYFNIEGQFSENIENIVSDELCKLYDNALREEVHKD